jgi:signal transduction histidine kinase
VFFLAVALGAQIWLHRLGERLQAETITVRRTQLLRAIELIQPGSPPWSPAHLATLGELLDARITLQPEARFAAAPGKIAFTHPLTDSAGRVQSHALVSLNLPAALKLQLAHARTWVLLLVLALGLGFLFITATLFWRRPFTPGSTGTQNPWRATRQEMGSLEQLVKTSAAQGTALATERDARLRTEQDLLLNQRLLTQSLEEKIHLGRDLHDGLIQSLYAVGITLESVRPLLTSSPAEADRRLTQCLENLNGAIRDVRNHITGLAPEKLRRVGFAGALELLVHELRGDRPAKLSLTIDDDAAGVLTPAQTLETLQIAARRSATASGMARRSASPCACTGLIARSASWCRMMGAASARPTAPAPGADWATCRPAPSGSAQVCGSTAAPVMAHALC